MINILLKKLKLVYKVLDKNSICSLIEMKPITGRKHQLRKQLYAVGQSYIWVIKNINLQIVIKE